MTNSITLAQFEKKANRVHGLLVNIKDLVRHMSYDELDAFEKTLDALINDATAPTATSAPSPVFPTNTIDPSNEGVVETGVNWRDGLEEVIVRAVVLQMGEPWDVWSKRIHAYPDIQTQLLDSTFADKDLDDTDLEEVVNVVTHYVAESTNDSGFEFDVEHLVRMTKGTDIVIRDLINLVRTACQSV